MASNKPILVTKYSGETEVFNPEKLLHALKKTGAGEKLVTDILIDVESRLYEGIPTKKIYKMAMSKLKSRSKPMAARFHLKQAIMELGPSGFPFENFVAALLKEQGFAVQVGVTAEGKCVKHEVDVIAEKDNRHFMIECKYHNQPGNVSNVKIPLYVHSRFLDVEEQWKQIPGHSMKFHQGWVVTNTRLTTDAVQYGSCAGLHLWSWDYPYGQGLKDIIDETGLYPLTCLTTLSAREKNELLNKHIVMCKELCHNPQLLSQIGIEKERAERIIKEGNELCHSLIQKKNH
ncbi:MAG: restriction endonuclease [Chitinophagaceae bacterium]|nr:restriction endonuclease [Chitinophagaceae bacterium]